MDQQEELDQEPYQEHYYAVDHVPVTKMSLWEKMGGRALSIAVVVHLLVLALGAFWIFQIIKPQEVIPDFTPPGGGGGERSADHAVKEKKKKVIVPISKVKRVVAEGARATYTIPDQGDKFGEMSPLVSLGGGGMSGGLGGSGSGKGFGKGNGSGMGNGHGTGKLFGLIPPSMSKRCSKGDRLARIKENGGVDDCEKAVVKGLDWLKANQNANGSWSGQSSVAMTGLALLAYFGHCETPASPDYGESCLKGIVYLVEIGMRNDGKIADNYSTNSWSYEHGIATYALSEAYTFCKEIGQPVPSLEEVTQKAGQYIIDHQNKNGGWAYSYAVSEGHTDMSVVGWQIQALKAGDHTKLKFQGRGGCLSRAWKYITSCQSSNGGYGYSGPNSSVADYSTLTGVGALCQQMWDKGNGAEVRHAIKYIRENTKFDYNGVCSDLYGHYYESQAMMQSGGEDWKFYNEIFRDQVLKNQDTDGSWKPPGGGGRIRAAVPTYQNDKVYRTCLCTLMLEVYYRFLSTGVGNHNY
ncbi:MAG: terpene cyclase/mutase family protein [Verrucomicrobia bacterium]|nr:MAG: terpene cyclase/mutase family protein [Verrucomicrobiota bacterium]